MVIVTTMLTPPALKWFPPARTGMIWVIVAAAVSIGVLAFLLLR